METEAAPGPPLQSLGSSSSLARAGAWAVPPPDAAPTEEPAAPLHMPECALRTQASPSVPSRQAMLCPLPHSSPFPSLWPQGAGPVRRWGHADGCVSGDPAVHTPSCQSDKPLCIYFCLEPHTAPLCGHHAHKGGPCVKASIFPCRKSGSQSLGWELAPVNSFARCCLALSGAWTPGVSPRLDKWLSDWLASHQPHVFCEQEEAARGRAGSGADAQGEPLFSGTWGLCANSTVRSHGVLGFTGQGQ